MYAAHGALVMEIISMITMAIYVLLRMIHTELCDRLPDNRSYLFDAAVGSDSGIPTSHIQQFLGLNGSSKPTKTPSRSTGSLEG